MGKKFTNDDFVAQVANEHPELEVIGEYNGNKNYVRVRCRVHNFEFDTKPNWLHRGCGCQKCYDDRRGDTRRKTQEQFIEEITKIYEGCGYDFSKTIYDGNNKTKVCVICPKHGEFWVTPNKMLNRHDGCPECAKVKNGLMKRSNTQHFIEKAKAVHGDKYDYSRVVYKTSMDKVCIICPKHGEFWQAPDPHLQNHGCPKCSESTLEVGTRLLLNELGIKFESQKRFDWLGRKSLDFFIPEYNIAIECQGGQHFKSVEHFGGEEALEERVEKDMVKKCLCDSHGIKMIYIVDDISDGIYFDKIFGNIYNKDNIVDLEALKIVLKGLGS